MKVMYKQDAVLHAFFFLKPKWAEMEITSKIRNVLFYQSGKLEFKPLRWACSFFSLNVCVHVCGLPWWLRICLQFRRPRFKPWVRKIPWRREWQPTSALLPRECHRQSSLAGYSPWDLKELDTTEWLTHTHTHTHTHTCVSEAPREAPWGHRYMSREPRVSCCNPKKTSRVLFQRVLKPDSASMTR